MVFGFNSDIRLGDLVLHVQTEDRAPRHPAIDTTVYAGGRVVHHRKNSYAERLNEAGFGEAEIRGLLEQQHRAVIEELRAGVLAVELFPPPPPSRPPEAPRPGSSGVPTPRVAAQAEPPPAAPKEEPSAIRVQLTNPASWLNAGSATLLVEVRARQPERPMPDAVVEVSFEGAQRPFILKTITDAEGRAEIGFPLPKFGAGGASLIIRATCVAGRDEIRYSLRPRSRPSAE